MAKDDDELKSIEKLTSQNWMQWEPLFRYNMLAHGYWGIVTGEEPCPKIKKNPLADLPIPPEVEPDDVAPVDEEPEATITRLIKNAERSQRRKDRLAIVAAHALKPTEEELAAVAKWKRKAAKIVAFIYSNVSADLRGDIQGLETPKEQYERLKSVHVVSNFLTKTGALEDLKNQRFHFGDNVDKFYANLQSSMLYAEALGNVIDNDHKNNIILNTLPKSLKEWVNGYSGRLPSQQSPIQTLTDVKFAIRKEEMMGTDDEEEEKPHRANYAAARGRGRTRGKRGNNKDRSEGRSDSKIECYNCGKLGHKAYQCKAKKKRTEDDSFSSDERKDKKDKDGKGKGKRRRSRSRSTENKKSRSRSRSSTPVQKLRRRSTATDRVRPGRKEANMAYIETDSVHSSEEEVEAKTTTDLALKRSMDERVLFAGPQQYHQSFTEWVKDSGTTDHMCSNKSFYSTYEKVSNQWVVVGNGAHLQIDGVGDCIIPCKMLDGSKANVMLPDVLHVPGLKANLVSTSALAKCGYKTTFEALKEGDHNLHGTVIDTYSNKPMFHFTSRHGLYHVDLIYHRPAEAFLMQNMSNVIKKPNRPKGRTRRARAKKLAQQEEERGPKRKRKSRKERHSKRYRYSGSNRKRHHDTSTDTSATTDFTDSSVSDSEHDYFCHSSDASFELNYVTDTSVVISSDGDPEPWIDYSSDDEPVLKTYMATKTTTRSKARKRHAARKLPLAKCGHDHDTEPALYEQVLHARLGHPHPKMLTLLSQKSNIIKLRKLRNPKLKYSCCQSCVEGRGTRVNTRRTAARRSTEVLEMIHADTAGPISPMTRKYRYFMVMVDDYTRYTTIALLHKKSEASSAIKSYQTLVETQTGKHIKRLKTDNGSEYCNHKVDDWCDTNGIFHDLSAPYTSRQAGVSERYIRTVTGKAKCMMHTAGAPPSFWDHAVLHAAYIMNRLPSEANPGKASPYELWNDGQLPDLDLLRVWGCNAYAILDKKRRDSKFGKNSLRCAFIGIDGDSTNYLLYNPKTKKVFSSANVMFDEADYSVMEELSGCKANGLGNKSE